MRRPRARGIHVWSAAVSAAALVGAAPAVAAAQTLGAVTPAGTSVVAPCIAIPSQNASFVVAQATSDPATPYTVPADGLITAWKTNQTGSSAQAGAQLALVVLRAATGGDSVVGMDLETLPASLPPDGNVTFALANPIKVAAGDELGLWSPSLGAPPQCFYATPSSADGVIGVGPVPSGLSDGQVLAVQNPMPVTGFALDLEATLVPNFEDAGVSATAGPANSIADEPALLSSTVTNAGPNNQPVTFTDTVPAGLTIDSAFAASGLCSTAAQTVTCTISGLTPGQSAPVQIVVTPTAAGAYQNAVRVSVPASTSDPNPANDAASAVLSVAPAAVAASAPPAPSARPCVVPALNRIPASFARRVLGLLGCEVGSVRRVHSKTVAKGDVIRSTPGAGTYAAAKLVSLQVSSGPAPKKRHR